MTFKLITLYGVPTASSAKRYHHLILTCSNTNVSVFGSPRPPSSEMIIERLVLVFCYLAFVNIEKKNVGNIIDDFPAIVLKGC